jgi:hypothetical protein
LTRRNVNATTSEELAEELRQKYINSWWKTIKQ